MRWKIFLLLFIACCAQQVNAQLDDQTIRDLKGGRVHNDSSYIYWLPYQSSKKFLLIQGWESRFSHKGELSLDFKMKQGTKIFAAREGVVTEMKEDSDVGGTKEEYLSKGNHVVIRHSDGSYAGYWHLQYNGASVNIGDSVTKGQLIGFSGNTGYSAFPHLHFWVYQKDSAFKTIPTRFHTKAGPKYLRPGQSYTSIHGNNSDK